jgi:acetyltransferase-like isoleucine patch superfamily enzyme
LGPIKKKMLDLLMRFISFIRYLERVHQNSCPCINIATSALVLPTTSLNCLKSGTIEIGEDTFVNDRCSITAYATAVKIGNDVFVGPGTVMHTYDHNFQRIDVPIGKQGGTTKPIIVEDDVWIGANCTILGGVTIGAHSVIGAHSLVNKSIPPYSVAYGVPCKVKRVRR